MPKKKKCPICNKTDLVIPFIYGFPIPELFEDQKKGLIKLGGCCQIEDMDNPENNSPEWHCRRDNNDF